MFTNYTFLFLPYSPQLMPASCLAAKQLLQILPAQSGCMSARLLSSITPCEKDGKQQAPDQNKKQAPAFKF